MRIAENVSAEVIGEKRGRYTVKVTNNSDGDIYIAEYNLYVIKDGETDVFRQSVRIGHEHVHPIAAGEIVENEFSCSVGGRDMLSRGGSAYLRVLDSEGCEMFVPVEFPE